jgi:hypothetical protein
MTMRGQSAFMRLDRALVCSVVGFTLCSGELPARTWTDAATGRTLEGDYVESDAAKVAIKSGGRTIEIDIARLSDADKAFIKEQAAKPAGGSSLARLAPPASLASGPIKGTGDDRKAEIEFTNESDKEVTEFVLDMFYLKADGSVGKSVPHTQGGSGVKKGKSETVRVTAFFMEDDTASIGAQVTGITFGDGSSWPAAPESPPARDGGDPVAAVVVGIIGEGDRAEPAAAFHNHGEKHVKSVYYRVDYLDGGGEVLESTSYGYAGGDDPILPSGKSLVITGGDGPPEGATGARATVTRLTFADDSEWKPAK